MAQLLPFCLAASGQLYNFSLPCFSCDWCLWPGIRRGWAPAWRWREWSPQQWGLLAAGLGHPSVLCWHRCGRRSRASELWQRAHTERETKATISILEVKWEIGHQVIRAIAVLPEANFPFFLCFQVGAGRALCVGVFCFFFHIHWLLLCSTRQDKCCYVRIFEIVLSVESGEDAGSGNAPGCLWWAETPRQQAIGKICGEEEPLLLHTPPSQRLVCSWWSNLLLTRSFRWAAEASNRDLCSP